MNQLYENQLFLVKELFETYTSNQPVIYSVFEKQFDGCAYVDDINQINWAILQTPFLQHFIAGTPTDGCESIIENILFHSILQEQSEKELVVFSSSEKWESVLNSIFDKHNGVSDSRKIFEFSKDNYSRLARPSIPRNIDAKLARCKNSPFSLRDSWSAKLMLDGQAISYCNAIMEGKNMAEIDICTDEAYRGKGYATISAFLLIDKLLEEGLTPTWSTWPFRVESQHIAKKLGFIPQPDAKAWIWQEGM